jgi:sarcosine oxidase subunit beta
LPEHVEFGQPTGGRIEGAVFIPESGFVSDPTLSTHNVQVAAAAKGAEFLFNSQAVEIRKQNNRVSGIALIDGTPIDAPIVINVAGPQSFVINRMAGVEQGMKIKTRPCRPIRDVPRILGLFNLLIQKLQSLLFDDLPASRCGFAYR